MRGDTVSTTFSGQGGSGNIRGGNVPLRTFDGSPSNGPESESEGLALRDYLAVLWRRKWVILLVVAVATTSAYFFSARQSSVYEADADLIYEKQLDISNPLTGQTYTDPTERTLELNSVASVLGSPDMVKRANALLRGDDAAVTGFEVSSAPLVDTGSGTTSTSTNVVRITVSSTDPQLAAAAADAYAAAFISWRAERVTGQIENAIDALRSQLASYEGAAKDSTDYLVLQQRLQDLEILKSTATGNFRVLVPATVPEAPVSPKPLRSALLGFGVGLFAAIGLAFLLEQFDTRLRRSEEVSQLLRQPILGRIPRISRKLLGENAVVTLAEPGGHAAEAFRLVRTNLDFMSVDRDTNSFIVTSCVQGEGKSVTVANLAVSMAMAGKKVVVVDGDLRRPRQHAYFGLPNLRGVSTVVIDQARLGEAIQKVQLSPALNGAGAGPVDLKDWAHDEEAPSHLYVLTSGPLPPNPGEIVSSKRFGALIEALAGEADIVLVDSPALLAVGDTAAMADKVDGLMFLVDMHVVTRPLLLQAADQLSKLPCRPLGLVVRTDGAKGEGYYHSSHRYQYSYSDNGSKGSKTGQAESGAGATAAAAVKPLGQRNNAEEGAS
jgi:Mrp family chromosome partitioning ATPase